MSVRRGSALRIDRWIRSSTRVSSLSTPKSSALVMGNEDWTPSYLTVCYEQYGAQRIVALTFGISIPNASGLSPRAIAIAGSSRDVGLSETQHIEEAQQRPRV